MTFNSNLAWKEASAAIAANRDVLLALAGVFFLLPSLAFGLFFPQPEPAPGLSEQQLMTLMSEYYASAMPVVIPMALVQAAGTLAMLTMLTDRSRPTVGEAIRQGFGGIVPYLLAQLLLGIGLGLAGGVLLAVASVSGIGALVAVAIVAILLAVAYAAIRTSLTGPIIAVERERNPVAALRRSWRLTSGNSARIGVFYLLVVVVFAVLSAVIMAVTGIVLALVAGGEAARIVATVLSAAIGAAMALYFVAMIAAVHRQLAGPSPETAAGLFD